MIIFILIFENYAEFINDRLLISRPHIDNREITNFSLKQLKIVNHMLNLMSDTLLGITHLFHGEEMVFSRKNYNIPNSPWNK
jgi:hypothetical protein